MQISQIIDIPSIFDCLFTSRRAAPPIRMNENFSKNHFHWRDLRLFWLFRYLSLERV